MWHPVIDQNKCYLLFLIILYNIKQYMVSWKKTYNYNYMYNISHIPNVIRFISEIIDHPDFTHDVY